MKVTVCKIMQKVVLKTGVHSRVCMKSMSSTEDLLTQAVVELIAVHKGIIQREIICKLKDEKLGSANTIRKKLNDLCTKSIIEYQTEYNKTSKQNAYKYYIYSTAKSQISYDKKLSDLIHALERTLVKIEKDSPNLNQDTRNYYYENLKRSKSLLEDIPPYLTKKQSTPDKYMVEKISEYLIYQNKAIKNKIKESNRIRNVMIKSKQKKSKAIQNLLQTKDDAKKGLLCNEIISNARDIEDSLNKILDISQELCILKRQHQEDIFKKIFDTLNTQSPKHTKNYTIFQKLRHLYVNTSETETKKNLAAIIHDFYKDVQKPVKKNQLLKKLVDSKQFTKKEADTVLFHMSTLKPRVIIHENNVYPLHIR